MNTETILISDKVNNFLEIGRMAYEHKILKAKAGMDKIENMENKFKPKEKIQYLVTQAAVVSGIFGGPSNKVIEEQVLS